MYEYIARFTQYLSKSGMAKKDFSNGKDSYRVKENHYYTNALYAPQCKHINLNRVVWSRYPKIYETFIIIKPDLSTIHP